MGRLTFVTDEHIPRALVNALRSEGYRVETVQERFGHGAKDKEILEGCGEVGAILLTNDTDFVEHAAKIQHSGIIIFAKQRLGIRQILIGIRRINGFFERDEMENNIEWLEGWL